MAILQSCCCWQSVRKGSYASAVYTMFYFMLTCIFMGMTIHHDLEYYWKTDNATNVKPKNASFLEPTEISSVTMFCYLIVFVLSALGIFSSVLLMLGLYFEIRFLLIPWMVFVCASSFADVSHSIYWLSLGDPNFNPLTAIFFTIELFVCCLNIYSILCVISQYQEYKAGRGTAAYDTLLETVRRREQTPSLSVRCSQQHTTGTSYLTTTVSHSNREFCPLPSECSNQSTAIVMDNIKSRRVQFTGDDESRTINSPGNSNADNSTIREKSRNTRISDPDEYDEDDYAEGRSDYLWCVAADEHVLICDLPSIRRESKDARASKKRASVSESTSDRSEKVQKSDHKIKFHDIKK